MTHDFLPRCPQIFAANVKSIKTYIDYKLWGVIPFGLVPELNLPLHYMRDDRYDRLRSAFGSLPKRNKAFLAQVLPHLRHVYTAYGDADTAFYYLEAFASVLDKDWPSARQNTRMAIARMLVECTWEFFPEARFPLAH